MIKGILKGVGPMELEKALMRIRDVLGAILGIIISIIPIMVVGILVKLDGGPIFFKQKRIGINGKPFVMWKIRSMVTDAENKKSNLIKYSDVEGMFKMKNDPRVTKIGGFIRKHSIDELPQFWNVLKGDMSLVGPRPALPSEFNNYSERDKIRLRVLPGMTGLWQVSGRNNVDFQTMIDLDLFYVANRSFVDDLNILFKTIILLFPSSKNGAY